MRVNVKHQKGVNKQRREFLDEAAKSSLNISITVSNSWKSLLELFVCDMLFTEFQKAVDPVVASYVRTKQSLMSTSLQVDVCH